MRKNVTDTLCIVHCVWLAACSVAGRGRQISNTHDTYLINAESAQEADSWVAAIRRVMHEVRVALFLSLLLC